MDIATDTFQTMPRRNAASYKYMIQIYERHLPPSKSCANICYALWTKACRVGLTDQLLFDQMCLKGYSLLDGKMLRTRVM